MSVVALADHVDVEPKAVHVELPGSCQGEATAGRMRRVVDVERLAAAIARCDALDLERQDVGDRYRALQSIHLELHRIELHAAEIAYQVSADHTGWPTNIAAHDG